MVRLPSPDTFSSSQINQSIFQDPTNSNDDSDFSLIFSKETLSCGFCTFLNFLPTYQSIFQSPCQQNFSLFDLKTDKLNNNAGQIVTSSGVPKQAQLQFVYRC